MKWVSIGLQMLVPTGVAIYTINFGRWMASRKIKSGAFGAYVIAVLAFVLSLVSLLKNNL